MPTTTEHPDHERVLAAYDARTDDIVGSTPRPWAPHSQHGRDFTDEAWSMIGAIAPTVAEPAFVALTYATGFEDSDDPEADARLIVAAVNTYEPALILARYVADRHRPITTDTPLMGEVTRCLACGTVAPCEEYAGAAAVVGVTLTMDRP